MKLKEWGLMRNKDRRARAERTRASSSRRKPNSQESRAPSATVEPMSIEPEPLENRQETSGLEIAGNSELAITGSNFMGLLNQTIKYVFEAYLCFPRTDSIQPPTSGRDTNLDARLNHRLRYPHEYAWLCA